MALHRVQFEAVCVEVRWHTCSPAWPCAQHAWPMHFQGQLKECVLDGSVALLPASYAYILKGQQFSQPEGNLKP